MAGGRATLGLYNSYDPVKFREAHRRALARAGALASAFRLNLATFGFPLPGEISLPREAADWVASTTSIGEDGMYLRELAQQGRFDVFPRPGKGFPPQMGEVVLTTSRPEEKKEISPEEVVGFLRSGRGVCLLFGLGPKGVPKGIRRITRYHLDITGDSRSLETCTAMGAVVGVIAHLLSRS
ncbi:MAG: DUF531 family protein [Methanomassiliicoccales archaeon]